MKTLPISLHTTAEVIDDTIIIKQYGSKYFTALRDSIAEEAIKTVTIPVKYWALFVSDISTEIMNHANDDLRKSVTDKAKNMTPIQNPIYNPTI